MDVLDHLLGRLPYLVFVVLLVVGFYLMMSHRNSLKGVVGLMVFQTSIILFFIQLSYINNATIPILNKTEKVAYESKEKDLAGKMKVVAGDAAATTQAAESKMDKAETETSETAYATKDGKKKKTPKYERKEGEILHNPLPHALMLTAIVVGVATLGVAIAILRRMQDEHGTIEDQLLKRGKRKS